MTTYNLSLINDGDSFGNSEGDNLPAFTASDYIYFDVGDISAADLTLTGTTSTVVKVNGITFTLANYSKDLLGLTTFIFTNGSVLAIGDSSTQNNQDGQANTLAGTEGNDYLDGRSGIDTVSYTSAQDAVLVNLNTNTSGGWAGKDKIFNVENIIGSVFNDTLIGSDGDNRIDGNGGLDAINAGGGNDTIIITSTYSEIDGGAGKDVIESSISFNLANVDNAENLTLVGSALIGVGSAGNNTINGNRNNNVLDGGGGNDVLIGSLGDDTYLVDSASDIVTELASSGTDSIFSSATATTLPVNVENLKLTNNGSQSGTGNTLDNIIYANVGDSTINGGDNLTLGDTLSYRYGATGGVKASLATSGVQDTGNSGQDQISGIENLTGSNYNDTLTGNSAANIINGGIGNDTINGGAGKDSLLGGKGNDVYLADDTADSIIEQANEGIDTVKADANYTIGSNIENLTMTDMGIGTGNALDNTLTSTGGATTLIGGTGNDTYVINGLDDVIIEQPSSGIDTVVSKNATYTLGANLENLIITGNTEADANGNDLANAITSQSTASINLYGYGGNDALTGSSKDDSLDGGKGDDIVSGAGGKDTVLGGEGNDKLDGGDGNDTVDGGLGSDNLSGGLGDDVFIVDAATDTVSELADGGEDTVQASVSYTLSDVDVENLTLTGTGDINATGNAARNELIGNNGDNVLDGKADKDVMRGGLGNDAYYVSDTSDIIVEAADEGTDSVFTAATYFLSDNIENLTLTSSDKINGAGNELDNTIVGGFGVNVLNGKEGNDSINGGSGDDVLIGDDGNDTLTGGSGLDQLKGGAGNDVYYVDIFNDVVHEDEVAGNDTVYASTTYTLTDEESIGVETLILTSTFTANGTGNSLANTLIGSDSFNRLDGGAGLDILTGNGGFDTFAFSLTSDLGTTLANTDQITDFSSGIDKIDIKALYGGQAVTLLAKGSSFTGVGIAEIRYEQVSADTFIQGDVDGDGAADFAIVLLGFSSNLAKTDFVV